MEQVTGRRVKDSRDAVVGPTQFVVTAENVPAQSIVHETAKEQVEAAVIIVVKPDGTGSPTVGGDARFGAHVGKGAIVVIMVKNGGMVIGGYQQVGPAIIVIVANGSPHREHIGGDSRFFRDIGKRAVSIVPVKSAAQRFRWLIKVTRTVVDQVNVHPAIIVVVEKGTARPQRLRQITLCGTGILVDPGDAALRRGNFFEQRLL